MEAQHYDIVIAGAGPTGLMLACQLSRFGIRALVLDKKSGPTTESRALAVQARSMEIYEQMGLSDEVEKDGRPSGGISLFKKGKKKASVFLRTMGQYISPFPYIMIYEQSKNETLLCKHLQSYGNEVQWNTEIKNLEEKDGHHLLQTVEKSGAQQSYSCNFLIACDGARSIVRDLSGMSFTGGTYENIFYVADTHARCAALSSDMLSLFITKKTFTLLFPLPGDDSFRLLGILPKEYYHHDTIQFDALINHVKESIQVPVEFYDTNWYSTYKLHDKKVAHFNKGNIFFAGDAAHIHSPVGGQGMNTGLQDAYNLAWKLALVAKGKAGNALLDTYHEERNPVAERLLKTTDRMFTIMTKSNPFFGFIKLFVVPRLVPLFNKFNTMRRLWFNEVSQIKINYCRSSLSSGKAGAVSAGSRFPYFTISHNNVSVSVFRLIKDWHNKPFLVLMYNLPDGDKLQADSDLFTIAPLDVTPDNTKALKNAGFPAQFAVAIRPDNYIAYIAEKPDAAVFSRFMQNNYHLL